MSDSTVLDLGRLELHRANDNISLRLSSEVTLITSGKDGNSDAHMCGLTHDLLYGDTSGRPWVQKGHNYRLVIDVQIAPELDIERQSFVHVVAENLKNSKARFETTAYVEIRPSDHHVISWALSLDYCNQHDTPQQRKLHKLMPDIPFHDTKPPPGVQLYMLQSVHLKMVLRRDCAEVARTAARDTHDDGFDIMHQPPSDDMLMSEPGADEEEQLYWAAEFDEYDSFEGEMLNTIPPSVDAETSIRQTGTMSGSLSSCVYPTPNLSQESEAYKQDPHGVNVSLGNSVVSSNPVIVLIGVGLSYAMFGPPNRRCKSTTLASNEDFKPLSRIAPSLWSLGYHRSIAGRAAFLPSLRHAIANLAQNRVTTNSLDTKVEEMSRRYRQTSDKRPPTCQVARPDEIQDALGVRLWRMMTSGLLEEGASKMIQPLSDNAITSDKMRAWESMPDMLDSIEAGGISYPQCGGSDFEDLLDQLSEAGKAGSDGCEEQDDLDSTAPSNAHPLWSGDGVRGAPVCWGLEDLPGCGPGFDLMEDKSGVLQSVQRLCFGTEVPSDAKDPGAHIFMGVNPKNNPCSDGRKPLCVSAKDAACMTTEDSTEEDVLFPIWYPISNEVGPDRSCSHEPEIHAEASCTVWHDRAEHSDSLLDAGD
ncbi:hypothetical protein Q7P37_008862 [Cladosporium fusiforme]